MHSIVYYSDKHCNQVILQICLENLRNIASTLGYELIEQISISPERSHTAMYTNILTGMASATGKIVFLAEHDVLYTRHHFLSRPNLDHLYYNLNSLVLTSAGFFNDIAAGYPPHKLSHLSGERSLLNQAIITKSLEKDLVHAEPVDGVDYYFSSAPNLDIRHKMAFTGSRSHHTIELNDRYWGMAEAYWKTLDL